jgi:hypothetical protein
MAKTLNFNTIKKKYLTVTFRDEEKTTVMIGTPNKAIMDELVSLNNDLKDMKDENNRTHIDDDTMDDLYRVSAKVISNNKGGVKMSKEKLEELFDFEDMLIFFTAYMEFMEELTNTKN